MRSLWRDWRAGCWSGVDDLGCGMGGPSLDVFDPLTTEKFFIFLRLRRAKLLQSSLQLA